jgi:hypothetical protein
MTEMRNGIQNSQEMGGQNMKSTIFISIVSGSQQTIKKNLTNESDE